MPDSPTFKKYDELLALSVDELKRQPCACGSCAADETCIRCALLEEYTQEYGRSLLDY